MGAFKNIFIYWMENVATEDELNLPPEERLHAASLWFKQKMVWKEVTLDLDKEEGTKLMEDLYGADPAAFHQKLH